MSSVTVLHGNALDVLKELPAQSVQCLITSPPYFNLRRYEGVEPSVWGGAVDCHHSWIERQFYTEQSMAVSSDEAFHPAGDDNAERLRRARWRTDQVCRDCGAWLGCLGEEPHPQDYIAHLLLIFQEVKRVLRDDGVCFLNLGDSYTASGKGPTGHNGIGDQYQRQGFQDDYFRARTMNTGGKPSFGLPKKSLHLIPARVAIALCDQQGWVIRSWFPWIKPSAMPESVTDRPTSCLEWFLMFTKKPRYYWDPAAVRGLVADKQTSQRNFRNTDSFYQSGEAWEADARLSLKAISEFRKQRGVILDEDGEILAVIAVPGGKSKKHFATYSSDLIWPLVLLATSEKGACAACGSPYRRQTKKSVSFASGSGKAGRTPHGKHHGAVQTVSGDYDIRMGPITEIETIGWEPGCACAAEIKPCVVLDPFGGSGTTGLVARAFDRDAILIDASREYCALALERLGCD